MVESSSQLTDLDKAVSIGGNPTADSAAMMIDVNSGSNVQILLKDLSIFAEQQTEYLRVIAAGRVPNTPIVPQMPVAIPETTPKVSAKDEETKGTGREIAGTLAKGALVGMLGNYAQYLLPLMSLFEDQKISPKTPVVPIVPTTTTPVAPVVTNQEPILNSGSVIYIDYNESSLLGSTLKSIKDSAEKQAEYLATLVDYNLALKDALIAQSVSNAPIAKRTALLTDGETAAGNAVVPGATGAPVAGGGFWGNMLSGAGSILETIASGIGIKSMLGWMKGDKVLPKPTIAEPVKPTIAEPVKPIEPSLKPPVVEAPAGLGAAKPGGTALGKKALSKLLGPEAAIIIGGAIGYFDEELNKAKLNSAQRIAEGIIEIIPSTLDFLIEGAAGPQSEDTSLLVTPMVRKFMLENILAPKIEQNASTRMRIPSSPFAVGDVTANIPASVAVTAPERPIAAAQPQVIMMPMTGAAGGPTQGPITTNSNNTTTTIIQTTDPSSSLQLGTQMLGSGLADLPM